MRVIGYVRDAPGPDDGDTVFVQSERIRRWVAHNRCQLVAVCQDTLGGDAVGDRDGYRALLGIISAGHVDPVLIPDLLRIVILDLQIESLTVMDALRKSNGNQSEAARALGISRTSVWSQIKRFDIRL